MRGLSEPKIGPSKLQEGQRDQLESARDPKRAQKNQQESAKAPRGPYKSQLINLS